MLLLLTRVRPGRRTVRAPATVIEPVPGISAAATVAKAVTEPAVLDGAR
jgi:hypothetical protein